jgi:hypothetical protein
MEQHLFDRLARRFARSPDRRSVVRAIAVLVLGAFVAAPTPAAAKRKKKGNRNKRKKRPTCVPACDGRLCGADDSCGGTCDEGECPPGFVCVEGTCQDDCPYTLCGEACVDVQSHDLHCGGCNEPCAGELRCSGGVCGCESGARCGTRCIDTQTDGEHCGGCGIRCEDGLACIGGRCGCASGVKCGAVCAECCLDGHCFGNFSGDRCIHPGGEDFGQPPYCGCFENEAPCGLNGECSLCCSPQECTERHGEGWTCKLTPTRRRHCVCDTDAGFVKDGNNCCKPGEELCLYNEHCCSGVCDFNATPAVCK